MPLGARSVIAIARSGMTWAAAWGGYYRSSDGSMVHVPYHTGRHMQGEMAICRDGTHSVSHHHRGTCSHHHGVARWER